MAVIRLETNKDNTQIIIKRLNYDRFAFHGFILSYGALAPKLRVPIEDVLIDYESFENLKKATLESKSPNFDPVDLKRWIDMLKSRNEKTQEEIINKYYQKENY